MTRGVYYPNSSISTNANISSSTWNLFPSFTSVTVNIIISVNTPCVSIWSYINMHKFARDMSPRNSITIQSVDIIGIVNNPDTSISTDTNINSSTINLIPGRSTVFNWNRNRYRLFNRYNRRCPLIDVFSWVCSPDIIAVTNSYTSKSTRHLSPWSLVWIQVINLIIWINNPDIIIGTNTDIFSIARNIIPVSPIITVNVTININTPGVTLSVNRNSSKTTRNICPRCLIRI